MALGSNALRMFFFLALLVCAAHAGKPAPKEKEEDSKKDDKSGASTPEAAAGPAGSAEASGPGGSFDISTATWAQKILIPKGDYVTGALNFTGPCKGSITIQVDGNLLGSTDLSQFKGNWIEIMRVDNLVITGKGKLDGQGPSVWSKNACAQKYD